MDIISGARRDRPGLDALRRRVEEGGVDAVVCVKLDRLGRSVLNTVELVQWLAARNVAVICTSQGIDTRADNPCGRMMLSVMAAFAEFERDIIRERTKAGLRSAKAAGKTLGQPSKTLVAPSERGAAVKAWEESGREGGLRGLAKRLGGCSPNTAKKVMMEVANAEERA